MIKRKVNLNDKRNIKLSLSCSKIESKIIEKLSKELKTSKTEVIILAVKKYEELIKKNQPTFKKNKNKIRSKPQLYLLSLKNNQLIFVFRHHKSK